MANANNGNWQTASRWADILRTRYRVTLLAAQETAMPAKRPDLVIALHARRAAAPLAELNNRYPGLPSILVLTGTDLYRDIRHDAAAQQSLAIATRLVLLQPAGLQELPPALQAKAVVIFQSAPALRPVGLACKERMRHFNVVMIGHLRAEKDPLTYMRAASQSDKMHTAPRIRFVHIGGALDTTLAAEAQSTQQLHANYQWLGNLPHAETRRRLKRCHLMALTSTMEGGAHVIIEAITSGVPVVASDISGNRGMLGEDYAGYFPVRDSAALAQLIERAASDAAFYGHLHAQCQARAPLFAPEREKTALLQLVDNTLHR